MQLNPFNDNYFMKEALKEAQKALEKNEVPCYYWSCIS